MEVAPEVHPKLWVGAQQLAICMGITQQRQFEQVPSATVETTLTLMPIDDPTHTNLRYACIFSWEHVSFAIVCPHPPAPSPTWGEGEKESYSPSPTRREGVRG